VLAGFVSSELMVVENSPPNKWRIIFDVKALFMKLLHHTLQNRMELQSV
jgi:hypothetical protein